MSSNETNELTASRNMSCKSCAFYVDTSWGIDCIMPNSVYDQRYQARHTYKCDEYPCDFAIDIDELSLLLRKRYNNGQ